MIMLVNWFNYCKSIRGKTTFDSNEFLSSAEIEVTVDFLIEIDKLVQLIESPIFTCKVQLSNLRMVFLMIDGRSSSCIAGC